MPTESSESAARMHLETTSERERSPPPWFAELTLLAHWFCLHGILPSFGTTLRLVRRVDATAALDVLLLAARIANGPLAHAYDLLLPVRRTLPALWGRKGMASRSATSRFFTALNAPALVRRLRAWLQGRARGRSDRSRGPAPDDLRRRRHARDAAATRAARHGRRTRATAAPASHCAGRSGAQACSSRHDAYGRAAEPHAGVSG